MLQLRLVKGIEYAGAFSALALAAFYILLSRYLIKHKNSHYRLISEAFVSIGIIFTTVAIPLAFDGLKTSAIWALEAAGIYWVSLRQKRQAARYFSTFLIFATSVSFFLGLPRGSSNLVFLNIFFFSCVLIATGFYFISFISEKYKSQLSPQEAEIPMITFIMGSIGWILGGLYEIHRNSESYLSLSGPLPFEFRLNLQLLYVSVGALIVFLIGQKIAWNKFKFLAHGFVFVLILAFLVSLNRYAHPFENFGYGAWAFAFLTYYYIQYSKIY